MARDPFRGTGGNVRWSREYQQFKESETEIPTTLYERLTEKAWNIYQIRLGSIPLLSRYKDSYQEHFEVARMDIEADQIGSLLVLPLLFFAPLTILATFLGGAATLFSLILPGFWIYWSLSYPSFRSTVVRIKSSDEALRVILYMAMQLEMNPNLSGAVKSAAGHTDGYLSKDLARVMWETETGQKRVQNIQQAISSRVDLWRKWSTDFVKSLEYLIDSLSRRGDERRRNEIVDSYTDIVNTAKLYCSKGTGSLTTEEISLSGVRAIYAAENKGNPPARTPKYVSSSQTSTGNYICLKFKKTSNPYACRQISCEINMTYIGTPLKGTNMYKLGKEDGSFEYNLEIIKKERKIRIKASHYP